MFRPRILLCSTVILVMLMGLTTTVTYAQDPDNGKTLWEETLSCRRCHGDMGEGVWGAPLAGDDLTAEEWIDQVRNPRNRMPSFSPEQVSDEQIMDVHAYLTSLPVPAETGFQQVDLPEDAHPGQVLVVEKRCVACHTTTGPIGPFQQRGEAPTAEAVIAQLRNPRQNMPSFSESQVSDEEAAQIADFLASQLTPTPQALPATGVEQSTYTFYLALFFGSLMLLMGFVLKRLMAQLQ
jgi:ubiquinol-cytochrome c reductase cytochrome c subunit